MTREDLEEWDDDGEENDPLPKDLMFDPWAGLSEDALEAFGPILQVVLRRMMPQGRRARRELIDGIFAIVPAIIANLLVLHHQRPEGSRLVLGLGVVKKTRYDRPGFRQLPNVVRVLQEAGLIDLHEAQFKQRRTSVEAKGDLKQLLSAPNASPSLVIRAPGEELIHLTARPVVSRIAGKKQPKTLVDYDDTEESIRLRAEMAEINRFLASRSIELQGNPQPAFSLVRRFALRRPDDPVQFNLHGRLYGGFWMTLKATERHRIRIDGEPIADLDFASMFPRLAYQHVGIEPPPGDLYAIPGLENHREGAKAALSALLSYESEMRSLPSRLKALLPKGWTASRVKQAFAAHHPDLVPLFGRDFGLDLMFTESRILLAALRRLMADGVSALPMHDGLMVPSSTASRATDVMRRASEQVVGTALPVAVKY